MSPQRHQSTYRILLHFVPVECYTAPAFVADRNGEMNHRFATMAFLLHIAHYRRQSTCLFGRRLSNRLCRLACEAGLPVSRFTRQVNNSILNQRQRLSHVGNLPSHRASNSNIQAHELSPGAGSGSFYSLDGHLHSSIAFQSAKSP
jgi:hypothetical protein